MWLACLALIIFLLVSIFSPPVIFACLFVRFSSQTVDIMGNNWPDDFSNGVLLGFCIGTVAFALLAQFDRWVKKIIHGCVTNTWLKLGIAIIFYAIADVIPHTERICMIVLVSILMTWVNVTLLVCQREDAKRALHAIMITLGATSVELLFLMKFVGAVILLGPFLISLFVMVFRVILNRLLFNDFP